MTAPTTDDLRAIAKRVHAEAAELESDEDRAAAEFGDRLGSLIDLAAKLIDDGEPSEAAVARLITDRRMLLGAVRRLADATEALYEQGGADCTCPQVDVTPGPGAEPEYVRGTPDPACPEHGDGSRPA